MSVTRAKYSWSHPRHAWLTLPCPHRRYLDRAAAFGQNMRILAHAASYSSDYKAVRVDSRVGGY
jgi:hypothetical protein